MPDLGQKKCFDYDVYHEGENKILKVYCERCMFPPSVEDSAICMAKLIDLLLQVSGVTTIIITQMREYEYDYSQTVPLIEIAQLYHQINKEERSVHALLVTDPLNERYLKSSYASFQRLISQRLKEDPLRAYVELKRFHRREKVKLENLIDERHRSSQSKLIAISEDIILQLEKTRLISLLVPHLAGYELGSREIYKHIFHPTTRPDFMYTKLITEYPDGDIQESYSFGEEIEKSDVTIFGFSDNIKTLYHLTPPEFKFTEEQYELLDAAKRIMAEHKPTKEEFVDPQRMREVFYNIGQDLLNDLIEQKNINLSEEEVDQLTKALLRYTVGFGLIEILLSDHKVQDVNINSPNGQLPIFLVHQDHGDCYTNIYPTIAEVDSWATKLRLISGRPLDEANPILDTELNVVGFSSRVSAISAPLSPTGMAFSFRRHRDYPWTFPLYLQPKVKMMNPLAAGLLSFLIDNNATVLIAGTRSSGKSSLLGSFLVEIMRRYRIITLEDTFELPQESLRALGYNIESLKVASALAEGKGTEVDASTGIRSTLRMGDSALFVGEVRSKEAIALFEAMRVGAAANVVSGTIHAASPYGVYDRVVNDIGVPKTSFKAVDIIVQTNPVRSASGLKKFKRVLGITEVRKEWDDDPLKEGAFVDLMKYNPKTDQLEVTPDLINGNSDIIKRMAGNIQEFAGDWDAVWNNIQLRADYKQAIVEAYNKTQDNS
ncbi:MAG: ATPase, T2SS/T4P/T4SS family, partial [Candidatus Woesearchaeota archaeon]